MTASQEFNETNTTNSASHYDSNVAGSAMTNRNGPKKGDNSESTESTRAFSTQSMSSLLAQALEVPSLDHINNNNNNNNNDKNHLSTALEYDASGCESTNSSTAAAAAAGATGPLHKFHIPQPPSLLVINTAASPPLSSTLIHSHLNDDDDDDDGMDDDDHSSLLYSPTAAPSHSDDLLLLPQHSDFTIPTSNARFLWGYGEQQQQRNGRKVDFHRAPPLEINPPCTNTTTTTTTSRNSPDDSNGRRSVFGNSVGRRYKLPAPPPTTTTINHNAASLDSPSLSLQAAPESPPQATYMIQEVPAPIVSPLTPARGLHYSMDDDDLEYHHPEDLLVTPKRLPWQQQQQHNHPSTEYPFGHRKVLKQRKTKIHETIHAQSLLLGLAFMAVWSPNNAMAPNLTQMAADFNMTIAERDLYLGSYCALALGVFSLPISGILGFMADFYSRKRLFVCCVVGGSLASAWTGWSNTFVSLFWARLMSGGCMSGSVPVAFSLLGDLFAASERNAASSGLTAMMGLGIVLGQVYAGTIGANMGWRFPFLASSILSLSTALMVIMWVREPARGAKEQALQGLLQSGNKYDRQLTLKGFMHAMRKNKSNSFLLWQGFTTSLPWGIVFVFLNDFLSQEKGFSVPDATFMVMLFGVGCAIGGISGGYIGQKCQQHNRKLLPLFMAITTFGGTIPFLGLLNSEFANKHGYKAMAYSMLGGCIASLPSANIRPCILNVNPPETRGAALTAANLLVALGRGMGPSCITLMGSIFHLPRQASFNITLTVFWAVTAILLLFLVKTLPEDQDAMEEDLAQYASEMAQGRDSANVSTMNGYGSTHHSDQEDIKDRDDFYQNGLLAESSTDVDRAPMTPRSTSSDHQYNNDGESLVSIEDYMTSFDGIAARRSLQFVQQGIEEIKEEMVFFTSCGPCSGCGTDGFDAGDDQDLEDEQAIDEILPQEELRKRRNLWRRQQQLLTESKEEDNEDEEGGVSREKNEKSPLLRVV